MIRNDRLQTIKRGGGFLARWGVVISVAWGATSVIISHVDRLVGAIHSLDVRLTEVEQYRTSHDLISHERVDRIDRLETRLGRLEDTRAAGWNGFDHRISVLEKRLGK